MSKHPTAPVADTRHRRLPELGGRDFDLAAAIIDAGRYCQLGFSLEGQTYVVPMACARDGRQLLMHGSVASRLASNWLRTSRYAPTSRTWMASYCRARLFIRP